MPDGEAVIPANRRPREREDLTPGILEIRDDLTGPCIENAKGGVDEVTVLAVLDGDEALVRTQARELGSAAGSSHWIPRGESNPGCAEVGGSSHGSDDVQAEAVTTRHGDDGRARLRGESLRPSQPAGLLPGARRPTD